MKKFIITGLLFVLTCGIVVADEITEDYFDIATNYCIQGKYKDAIEYLDKILLSDSTNKKANDLRNGLRQIMQNKNNSYIQSKTVKDSIKAKMNGDKLEEFYILKDGTDYWSYYFLGQYYRDNKDYELAVTNFVKSMNTKPTLNQCYLQIALCYYEKGNLDESINYLNQYLKLNPQDDFAYYLKAEIETSMGDHDPALNDISTALSLENNPEYRFTEAKILYNMTRYTKAVGKLETLTNDIQTAELYKYLGLAYAQLGNTADAIINLEKSILLYDDDNVVNMKYNELVKEQNET